MGIALDAVELDGLSLQQRWQFRFIEGLPRQSIALWTLGPKANARAACRETGLTVFVKEHRVPIGLKQFRPADNELVGNGFTTMRADEHLAD